jgi:hypothetical protein
MSAWPINAACGQASFLLGAIFLLTVYSLTKGLAVRAKVRNAEEVIR